MMPGMYACVSGGDTYPRAHLRNGLFDFLFDDLLLGGSHRRLRIHQWWRRRQLSLCGR